MLQTTPTLRSVIPERRLPPTSRRYATSTNPPPQARSAIRIESHVNPPRVLTKRQVGWKRFASAWSMNVMARERESQSLSHVPAYFAIWATIVKNENQTRANFARYSVPLRQDWKKYLHFFDAMTRALHHRYFAIRANVYRMMTHVEFFTHSRRNFFLQPREKEYRTQLPMSAGFAAC
jgi:hypothetical protein